MKTLAVVLGNNDYYGNSKLTNAVNDATAIADVFKRLSFNVVLKTDFKTAECTEILRDLETMITDYDATIFYFAGHGFELRGENFLASIECQVHNPEWYHCGKTCITMSDVMRILKLNTSKINIVIIDACRKSFERGTNSSFAPIQSPKGTLIAYSTSPNEGARDAGIEGHSIYTGAMLKYIGREMLSVEELFKKVRKTVYNLSDGRQTPWEHTSLIGDFHFNTGQLIYSIDLPYDESVVKDSEFKRKADEFSALIFDLKSSNWDKQNPAIERIMRFKPNSLDKSQQFILGRNLYQLSGYAFSVNPFFRDLRSTLLPYSERAENHVLNGMLYEIYFDSHNEFRRNGLKKQEHFEHILKLRKDSAFASSFDFIQRALAPFSSLVYYIPNEKDVMIDVDVSVTTEKLPAIAGWDTPGETVFEVINSVHVFSKDITNDIGKYGLDWIDNKRLIQLIAGYLSAPEELVQINSNIDIKHASFRRQTNFLEY